MAIAWTIDLRLFTLDARSAQAIIYPDLLSSKPSGIFSGQDTGHDGLH